MSAFHDNALIGASGSQGYQISRSVRLRSSASAYFNRTPASAGNRKTWTWSGWVKRGTVSPRVALFGFGTSSAGGSASGACYFDSNTIYVVSGGGTSTFVSTTPVYRDPSAWYHVVIAFDSTQATASNRVKIYINGSQVTALANTTYPSQNYDSDYNNTTPQYLGARGEGGLDSYFDGYITEINSIDGQALTPSSFGETNPVTGVWQPKKYTGTYGTNGFYLNFSDNSSNTATTIGKDYSGNGNNWTPNNISVTAGATYDSMLDVPTQWADGGNGRGNYATMNPVAATGGVTLTNGNLRASVAQKAAPRYISVSTIAFTGIVYAEVTITPGGGPNPSPSIGIKDSNYKSFEGSATTAGQFAYGFRDSSTPNILKDENGVSSTLVAGGSMSSGDVMMLAVDVAAGKMWLGKNGSWLASGNPATGANPAISGFSTTVPYWFFCATDQGTTTDNVFEWNFGQRPFSYTPPSGFKALNTLNLPTPTILKGNQYFDAVTYAGSASQQTITTSLTGLDLAWIKNRTTARDHVLVDTVRGGSPLLTLYSDLTAAEDNSSPNYNPTSFTTSGIVLGGAKLGINNAGENFVLWGWKEGATQGFDIVTFTAPATNQSFTVNHSLGVTPSMIIVKRRDSATGGDWWTWHIGLGNNTTDYVALNQTAAEVTAANMWGTLGRNSTAFGVNVPTSCVANGTYVAYLFAEVAGFSRFGSYTGNGSTDGPMIFTGFRPAFVLIKQSSASGQSWQIQDSTREPYNDGNRTVLFPDLSNAEITDANPLDFLSNGFKIRNAGNGNNASGATYIYAAFAANPFKNALAF